jgi:hypothetical protein
MQTHPLPLWKSKGKRADRSTSQCLASRLLTDPRRQNETHLRKTTGLAPLALPPHELGVFGVSFRAAHTGPLLTRGVRYT